MPKVFPFVEIGIVELLLVAEDNGCDAFVGKRQTGPVKYVPKPLGE